MERRLLRHGLTMWRYNDDFRISVDTWSDALNAVDTLERECREVGLVLNDSKTFISKHATYEVNPIVDRTLQRSPRSRTRSNSVLIVHTTGND